MEHIDRAIEFMVTHRGMKVTMFQTIKKTLYESSNMRLEYDSLRQLLFLDEQCYSIEWRKVSESSDRYDLKVTIPNSNDPSFSIDLRKMEMRKKIVKYLLTMEA